MLALPYVGRLLAPDIVISVSLVGERRARKVVRSLGCGSWIHLGDPKENDPLPDLSFVPEHDWRAAFDDRPEFVRISGVTHDIERSTLQRRRSDARERLMVDGRRAVACFIGGPNTAFDFDSASTQAIETALLEMADPETCLLISTSRRTPPAAVERFAALARRLNARFFGGGSDNPYRDYLAAADAILVTEDSMTMTCEALAVGVPVRLLRLAGIAGERLDKFRRFQRDLIETRRLLSYYATDIGVGAPSGPPLDTPGFVVDRIMAEMSKAEEAPRTPRRRRG